MTTPEIGARVVVRGTDGLHYQGTVVASFGWAAYLRDLFATEGRTVAVRLTGVVEMPRLAFAPSATMVRPDEIMEASGADT